MLYDIGRVSHINALLYDTGGCPGMAFYQLMCWSTHADLITIPYNNQCGGRGSTTTNGWPGCGTAGRECWDAPWSGVQCASGTSCVKSNEWWWFCNYNTLGECHNEMPALPGEVRVQEGLAVLT